MKITKRHIKKTLSGFLNKPASEVSDSDIARFFKISRAAVGKWSNSEQIPELRRLQFQDHIRKLHIFSL